jgi:hypothetical protein
VGVVALCSCCCASGVLATLENGPPASQPPASQPPVFVPTPTLPATPPPAPTPVPPAYVGGPYANFVAHYGPPFRQGGGGSVDFYVESTHRVVVNVAPAGGIVTHVGVQGPASWPNQAILDYCDQFLPADATEFRVAGSDTYYHSQVGVVALDFVGAGVCLVLDYGTA